MHFRGCTTDSSTIWVCRISICYLYPSHSRVAATSDIQRHACSACIGCIVIDREGSSYRCRRIYPCGDRSSIGRLSSIAILGVCIGRDRIQICGVGITAACATCYCSTCIGDSSDHEIGSHISSSRITHCRTKLSVCRPDIISRFRDRWNSWRNIVPCRRRGRTIASS